jgi:hypothetical protein
MPLRALVQQSLHQPEGEGFSCSKFGESGDGSTRAKNKSASLTGPVIYQDECLASSMTTFRDRRAPNFGQPQTSFPTDSVLLPTSVAVSTPTPSIITNVNNNPPSASPSLILAFLAVGLFTSAMMVAFGCRRANMGRRHRPVARQPFESSCQESGERPKLWDLWAVSGTSGSGRGWKDIMVRSFFSSQPPLFLVLTPPPPPFFFFCDSHCLRARLSGTVLWGLQVRVRVVLACSGQRAGHRYSSVI